MYVCGDWSEVPSEMTAETVYVELVLYEVTYCCVEGLHLGEDISGMRYI